MLKSDNITNLTWLRLLSMPIHTHKVLILLWPLIILLKIELKHLTVKWKDSKFCLKLYVMIMLKLSVSFIHSSFSFHACFSLHKAFLPILGVWKFAEYWKKYFSVEHRIHKPAMSYLALKLKYLKLVSSLQKSPSFGFFTGNNAIKWRLVLVVPQLPFPLCSLLRNNFVRQ